MPAPRRRRSISSSDSAWSVSGCRARSSRGLVRRGRDQRQLLAGQRLEKRQLLVHVPAVAADVAVDLEEAASLGFRWTDRLDGADECIVALDRHAFQAVAEPEQRDRRAQLRIVAKAVHEHVGAGRLDERGSLPPPASPNLPCHDRRDRAWPVSSAAFLRREFGEIAPPQCLEPLRGATEQRRHLPGERVIAHEPANIAKQVSEPVAAAGPGLG